MVRGIPEFPKFKKLSLNDKEEIESYTKQFPPYSDFHFIIMWSWDINEPVLLSLYNDNLLLRSSDCSSGESYYTLIGTKNIGEIIPDCLKWLKINKHYPSLKWIPEEIIHSVNHSALPVMDDRDNYDYIYGVTQLYKADGKNFATYRGLINRFKKRYPNLNCKQIDIIQAEIKSQIIELFKRWRNNKSQEKTECKLVFEYKALKKLLKTVSQFKSVYALGIYHESDLIAFNIIDVMNKEYACIPFIKADTNFKGVFQYLMNETIKNLYDKGIKFINFEADLGIPSLRASKLSFRPIHFLKKFTIENNS